MSDITVNPADVTFNAVIEQSDDRITVCTTVEGIDVDRPEMVGYGLSNMRNARRLVKAIEEGAVFHDLLVKTDVNGKTYLSASSRVFARYMNSDLKRIGY